MPKKSPKTEITTSAEPKPGISSFSLLDTPKLKVEESPEEPASELPSEIEKEEKPPEEDVQPKITEDVVTETVAQDNVETSEPSENEPSETPTEEKDEGEKEPVSSDEVKEWLKDIRPDTTKEVEKGGGPNFKIVLFILAGLLLIGAVVGGIVYFSSKVSKTPEEEAEEVSPSITVTPTPTVTQEEGKIDISKYKVNILNGSGIPGEAKKVADSLTNEGFKDIKTGNAASYDFTTTEVSLKTDIPDSVYEKIEKALSETYNVAKSKTSLDKSSSYDVIITVGTKK